MYGCVYLSTPFYLCITWHKQVIIYPSKQTLYCLVYFVALTSTLKLIFLLLAVICSLNFCSYFSLFLTRLMTQKLLVSFFQLRLFHYVCVLWRWEVNCQKQLSAVIYILLLFQICQKTCADAVYFHD